MNTNRFRSVFTNQNQIIGIQIITPSRLRSTSGILTTEHFKYSLLYVGLVRCHSPPIPPKLVSHLVPSPSVHSTLQRQLKPTESSSPGSVVQAAIASSHFLECMSFADPLRSMIRVCSMMSASRRNKQNENRWKIRETASD